MKSFFLLFVRRVFFLAVFAVNVVKLAAQANHPSDYASLAKFGNNVVHCVDMSSLDKGVMGDTVIAPVVKPRFENDIRRFFESGNTNMGLGNYNEAASEYAYALDFATMAGDSARMAALNILVGAALDEQYRYAEALSQYQKGLAIAERCGADLERISALTYIGGINYRQGNYDAALNYFVEGLSLSRKVGYRTGEAATLNNVGEIHRMLGNYANALSHFEAALQANTEGKNAAWSAINYENIGMTRYAMGLYSKALESYMLALASRGSSAEGAQGLYVNIGQVYEAQGRDDVAESYYLKAFDQATAAGDWTALASSAGQLADLYAQVGHYRKAYFYRDRQAHASDSLNAAVTHRQLLGLQARYDMEAKRNELALKDRELALFAEREASLDLQRKLLLTAVALAAVVLASALVLVRGRMRAARRRAEQQLKVLEAERRLHAARLEAAQAEKTRDGELLELRQGQMLAAARSLSAKNELLQEIRERALDLAVAAPDATRAGAADIARRIKVEMGADREATLFRNALEEVSEAFLVEARTRFPDLTQRELALLAMMRVGLSTKEIASLQSVSPKAVDMAKYRLKKRLGVEAVDDIRRLIKG